MMGPEYSKKKIKKSALTPPVKFFTKVVGPGPGPTTFFRRNYDVFFTTPESGREKMP
jgi:hypothetical protein